MFAGEVYRGVILVSREPCSNRGYKWLCKCLCGNTRHARKYQLLAEGDDLQCQTCSRSKPRKSKEHVGHRIIYNQHLANVRSRSLLNELTEKHIKGLVIQNCTYCGDPPSDTNSKINMAYNGIDRIDSSIGYTLDNSIPCCAICNMMKKNLDVEVWINKMKTIIKFQENI